MKLAIITSLLDVQTGGGAARSALAVGQVAADAGADVILIAIGAVDGPAWTTTDGLPTLLFAPHNLYPYTARHAQSTPRKMLWQLRALYNPHSYEVVRQTLEHLRPDIVHTQKIRGIGAAAWRAAYDAGVRRIVHTARDLELLSPEATLQTRWGRWAARSPYADAHARLARPVTHFTGPSAFIVRAHTERGLFRHITRRVIPNTHGLRDADLAMRAAQPVTASGTSPLRLLYVGRLVPEKGIDRLCTVVAGESEYHLDIVGDGPLADNLRAHWADAGNITFHGPLYGDAKDAHYAACDVVVLPSQVPESFGNVIVEAYTHGKPVIGSRIGAIPELIEPGCTGYFVPIGDSNALGNVLWRLDRDTLHLMRGACFAAAHRYTTTALQRAYTTLYDEILADGA